MKRSEWTLGAPILLIVMLLAGALGGLSVGLFGNVLSAPTPGYAVILPIIALIGGLILGLVMAVLMLSFRALLGGFVRGRVQDIIAVVLAAAVASGAFFLVFLSQQREWNGAIFVVVSTLIGAVVGTATLWLARRRALAQG